MPSNTWTSLFTILVVSIGTWLPMGFSITAMNAPRDVILNWVQEVLYKRPAASNFSGELSGLHASVNTIWAVSSALFMCGGFVSTSFTNLLIGRIGLHRSLDVYVALFIFGTALFSASKPAGSYELLMVGRLLIGASFGIVCTATPLFTASVFSAKKRGAVVTLPNVCCVAGLLIASALGLPDVMGNTEHWNILVIFALIPPVLMAVTLPSLNRRCSTKSDVKSEVLIQKIPMVVATDTGQQRSVLDLVNSSDTRWTLFVCVVPMLAQQFSGFSCMTFYSNSVFEAAGMTRALATYSSMGMWVTLLIGNTISMVFVDKFGRRPLLIGSHIAMIGSMTSFVVVALVFDDGLSAILLGICLYVFILGYSVGSASIPYILPTEMFAEDCRQAAVTAVNMVSWGTAFVTTFSFPYLQAQLDELSFLVFIGILSILTVFIYLYLPETKMSSRNRVEEKYCKIVVET